VDSQPLSRSLYQSEISAAFSPLHSPGGSTTILRRALRSLIAYNENNVDGRADLNEVVDVQHKDLSARYDELIDAGDCMRPAANIGTADIIQHSIQQHTTACDPECLPNISRR